MKKLISNYIRDKHSVSVKELAIVKAHLIYTNCDTFKDELSLVRADLLEEIERDLVLYEGYSITTRQELFGIVSDELDELVEYYANDMLDNLHSL